MRTPSTVVRALFILVLSIVPISLAAQGRHGTHPAESNGHGHGHHHDPDDDHPPVEPNRLLRGQRLNFTENLGQVIDDQGNLRPDLFYVMKAGGVRIYLAKDRIHYTYQQLTERAQALNRNDGMPEPGKYAGDTPDGYPHPDSALVYKSRVTMEFIGANPNVRIEASGKVPQYTNYYLAHCPQGITNVPGYETVTYHEIYPNIDLVVQAVDKGTKYDFVVRPGGRVSDIRIRYNDADAVKLLRSGAMRVTNPLGYLEEGVPYTYQTLYGAGTRKEVRSRYQVQDGIITFDVDRYDPTRTLVIDPTQEWATLYGGSAGDQLIGGDPTEVDRSGNCFVVGFTTSNNFPTRNPYQAARVANNDAFIVKFDPYGNVVFATYYGGNGDDIAHGVTADPDGSVFVAGHTESSNLPTLNAFQPNALGNRDGFVAKFSAAGTLSWGTYSGTSFWDDGYAFAVDSSKNAAYLLTSRGSTFNNTTGTVNYLAARDGAHPTGNFGTQNEQVLVKYHGTSGQMIWAKFIGGSNDELGYSAATDVKNNIIITGWTQSNDFPTTPGCAQNFRAGSADCFVVKLDSSGVTRWSTYYGGPQNEDNGLGSGVGSCGMATDYDGNIFITGTTAGGFPATAGSWYATARGGNDAFLVKFDTNGVRLWATYIGTNGADFGMGCAANPQGSVLVTGYTNGNGLATNGPGQDAPFQANKSTGDDAFVAKLDKNGAPKWVTYFGSTGNDEGHGTSYDPYGSIVLAGMTSSSGAPFNVRSRYQVANGQPLAQAANAGMDDAFMTLFCDPEPPRVDSSGDHHLCDGEILRVWIIPGYRNVKWYKKDPPTYTTSTLLVTGEDTLRIQDSGRYFVSVENATGCQSISDDIIITRSGRIGAKISPDSPAKLCIGDTLELSVGPNPIRTYTWIRSPGDTVRTATMKVWQGGTYKVFITNNRDCIDSTTVVVQEFPKPTAVLATRDTVICEDETAQLTAAGGTGGTITWYKVGSATSVGGGPSYSTNKSGIYYATSTSGVGCVTRSNNVTIKVNLKPKPKLLALLPVSFCEGDSTALEATPGAATEALLPGGNYRSYLWSNGATSRRISVRSADIPFGTTTFSVTVTDTNGCTGDAQLQVTKNQKPRPRIVPGDTIICEGDSVTLSSDASFSSYAWNNGSTEQRIKAGRPGTTAYVLTVFTTEGCFGVSDTVRVTVIPRPIADISGPIAVCINSTQSYEVPAGTGVTYSWEVQGPAGTIANGAGTSKIDVNWGSTASDNRVIVTITNTASGCKTYDTLLVKVGSVLQPNITITGSLQLCPGDTVELDAGSGFSKYTWSNGATSQKIRVTNPGGTFTVTVENATGCSGTSLPVNVTNAVPRQPVITPNRSLSLCPGDTVELDAGTGFTDYIWSNGASIQRIKIWASGTFTVTTTDSNGCDATSQSVDVVMNTPPAPVIDGPNSACINSTVPYNVTVPGGGSGDTYQWVIRGPGGVLQSGQGTGTISVLWNAASEDTVEVTVTSGATGCVGTMKYPVTVGTTLSPVITTNTGGTGFCPGDSITLIAPAGYSSYAWLPNGETAQTITVGTDGVYQVTVSDAFGCSGTGEITVTQNPPFRPPVTASKLGFCPGDSVLLEAPIGFAKYLWTPTGDTVQAIWVKAAGAYNVTATDNDGCTGTSDPVNVTAYANPIIRGINQVGLDLVADVDEVGGPAIAGYQWYRDGSAIAGANARNYTTTSVGDYSVTCTSVDGCVATFGPVRPFSAASSAVELPTLTAAPGERVVVPIMMTASDNLDRNQVEEFEATLRFNKTLLMPADNTPNTVVGPDRLMTIKGTRPTNLTTGELMRLEFIAALGNAESTPLTLEGFRWIDTSNGPVQVSTVNGMFTLNNICETGGKRLLGANGATKISAARPNPTSGLTDIEYEVVERGQAQLYVVDVLGNRIATLVDGLIAPGSYLVQFNAESLASGLYYCVLVTPTERHTHMLHVVR